MGDRARNIARAIEALAEHGVRVTRQSALYETEPVDVRGGAGWFLNGVVEAETDLMPRQLMNALLAIERSLGRKRGPVVEGGPKESRTIDMDILFFGSTVVSPLSLQKKNCTILVQRLARDAQPVQRNRLRRERLEFDLRQVVDGLLSPSVDARLRIFREAPAERPEEIARIVDRSGLARRRPRERFDHVAAQQLRPVRLEHLRRREHIAPRHFVAERHHDANHAPALDPRGRPSEAPPHFIGESSSCVKSGEIRYVGQMLFEKGALCNFDPRPTHLNSRLVGPKVNS